MPVDLKIVVELTPKQVQDAIRHWLSTIEGLVLLGDVKFDIGPVSEGYGLTERNVTSFRGASCNVKKTSQATSYDYRDR